MSLNVEAYALQGVPDFETSIDPETSRCTERRMHPKDGGLVDGLIALLATFPFLLLISLSGLAGFHWSVIPAMLAGAIMGKDMVALLRGKMDMFDPKGIIGTLGFLFFFISHVSHVYNDNVGVAASSNGTAWFGYVAIINLVGSFIYLLGQRVGFSGTSRRVQKYWCPPPTVPPFLTILTILSALAWGLYMIKAGGYEAIARSMYQHKYTVRGLGPLALLGDSAPVLLFLGLTLLKGSANWYRKSNAILVLILVCAIFIVQFVITGVTGSRSRIMWAMFSIAGMIHYCWRPIKRVHILYAILPLVVFIQAMALYKEFNVNLFSSLKGASVSDLMGKSSRKFGDILTGDIGRTDIQAQALYATTSAPDGYDFRFGSTYLFGPLNTLPGWVWPHTERPYDWSKGAAGTEIFRGKGSYSPTKRDRPTYAQYGLVGESLMNFGLVGVFPAFMLWGFFVGRLRRMVSQCQPGDLRLIACLFLTNAAFVALPSDFDNIFDVLLMKAMVPIVTLYFISRKVPAMEIEYAAATE